METITSTDGTPIAFERTGSGPPFVLVHGGTADHTRWEPIRPALADRFTVYAMDRRGRGESGDAQEYAIEREFEDVAAVVESIDEPARLLGHSYGAIVALEAALRLDDLHALVLYEPPLPVSDLDPDSAEVLAEMEALIETGEREQALLLFLGDIANMPQTELAALRSAPNWPARVEAVHTIVREERARKAYEFDDAKLGAVTTPTLLLMGSETAPFTREATEALNDVLPNSRIVVMEGQAHAAMSTAPELFADEVLAFLQGLQ